MELATTPTVQGCPLGWPHDASVAAEIDQPVADTGFSGDHDLDISNVFLHDDAEVQFHPRQWQIDRFSEYCTFSHPTFSRQVSSSLC